MAYKLMKHHASFNQKQVRQKGTQRKTFRRPGMNRQVSKRYYDILSLLGKTKLISTNESTEMKNKYSDTNSHCMLVSSLYLRL